MQLKVSNQVSFSFSYQLHRNGYNTQQDDYSVRSKNYLQDASTSAGNVIKYDKTSSEKAKQS